MEIRGTRREADPPSVLRWQLKKTPCKGVFHCLERGGSVKLRALPFHSANLAEEQEVQDDRQEQPSSQDPRNKGGFEEIADAGHMLGIIGIRPSVRAYAPEEKNHISIECL